MTTPGATPPGPVGHAHGDRSRCAACRAPLAGARLCPACGLDQSRVEVLNALKALDAADGWIHAARAAQAATPVPSTPASSADSDTDAGTGPWTAAPAAHPPTSPPAPPRRRWTAGSVLLALGAGCIVVAGLVFVGVAWGGLGAAGRALVLVLVTLVVGVVARLVHRRRLLASAEALWAVFLGLATIDWFAARGLGLLDLDRMPLDLATLLWGVGALGLGVAIVVTARPAPRDLLVPQGVTVLGVVGMASATASLGAVEIGDVFTVAALAAVAAGAAALVLHVARLPLALAGALAVTAVPTVAAVVAAFVRVAENPALRDLVLGGEGLPLLLVAVLVVGSTVRARPWVRTAAAALAATAVAALVLAPWSDAFGDVSAVVAGTTLVALGAVLVVRADPWSRGVRLVVTLGGGAVGLALLTWLDVVGDVLSRSSGVSGPGYGPLDRVRAAVETPFGPVVLLVVGVGLLVATEAARRWPESRDQGLRPLLRGCVVVGVPVLLVAVVADVGPPLWLVAVLAVGLPGAAAALLRRRPTPGLLAAAVVALAPLAVMASTSTALVAAVMVGGVLVALAVDRAVDSVRATLLVGVGTAWLLVAVQLGCDLAGVGLRDRALVSTVAAVLVLAASWATRPRAAWLGVLLAATGGGVLAVGQTFSAVTTSADLVGPALVLVVLGAATTALSFVDRRAPLRPVGAALLGAAWVVRLAASEVDVVEAYTAPFAVLLLAAGSWTMLRRREASSVVVLAPGVVLALVPSLPQALADPGGLRAFLLGLVAAGLLLLGLWRRWQVPFAGGASVLGVLVLVNAAPYAGALPRWVLIATLGVVLVGTGLTWERRVRDGRAAVQFVREMR